MSYLRSREPETVMECIRELVEAIEADDEFETADGAGMLLSFIRNELTAYLKLREFVGELD